jgi:hypothetical protein
MERARIQRLLNISSRVPNEGASPPPPPRGPLYGVSSETDTSPLEPLSTNISKSPVDEPSSRFPKRGPYGKRCPSPEPFPHILQGPQQGSPPSRFPSQSCHREREIERERERHFTHRAPFNHISKSPVDEPTPAWKVTLVTVIHFMCRVALYLSTPADNRRLVK